MRTKIQIFKINGRLVLKAEAYPNLKPISIDLESEQKKWRLKTSSHANDPLLKAMGKQGKQVFDCTFGFGTDAMNLITHGYHVTAVERSPELVALWQDAVEQLKADSKVKKLIASNLKIIHDDAKNILQHLSAKDFPDIIYLDPMYPEKKKQTALQRKEMLLLRELVGEDEDSAELFLLAKTKAKYRVVVKRPVHAEPLIKNCDYSVTGKTVRFDIYLINK